MAPLGVMDRRTNMNLNNDDAFLSLLSSQRELLNRLNMEGSKNKDHKDNKVVVLGNKRKRGSIVGSSDPLSLMNTSISTHGSSSFDMLFSRRLSLTLGGDFFGFPPCDPMYTCGDEEKAKDLEMGAGMKRRRSSLDLFGSMASEDPYYRLTNRRFSMLSTLSGYSGLSDGMDQDFQCESTETAPISLAGVRLDPNIPPEKVKENLSAFAVSMDRSTKSQQDIHAWDRKMGLKRSHSKTMRMTMRSRKKLRSLLKKDINSLYQGNH